MYFPIENVRKAILREEREVGGEEEREVGDEGQRVGLALLFHVKNRSYGGTEQQTEVMFRDLETEFPPGGFEDYLERHQIRFEVRRGIYEDYKMGDFLESILVAEGQW